jgi:hypothetical protein
MNQQTYIKNIERFALPKVSLLQFKRMLRRTSSTNRMEIKWRTAIPPTHRTSHEVFWGDNFSASDQSFTKEAEGMVNLEAPNTIEGWRTLTYDNISSFKFEGKSYTIIY